MLTVKERYSAGSIIVLGQEKTGRFVSDYDRRKVKHGDVSLEILSGAFHKIRTAKVMNDVMRAAIRIYAIAP